MKNKNTLNNGQDYSIPRDENKTNWTARKWFASVAIFLLCWIGLYLLVHLKEVYTGYINLKFTSEEIQQINKILYAKDNLTPVETLVPTKTVGDTAPKKDTSFVNSQHYAQPSVQYIAFYDKCDDSCRVNKAMLYIRSEFENNLKSDQLDLIKEYISSFGAQEVGSFLVHLKLKVRSYFWFTGIFVYLEIIFWSIVGVICSILFSVGNAARHKDNVYFNPDQIPYDIAKIFYAPFCTIVFVLGYNYIKHRNVIEVNTNEGMLVFSFVSGLFAGRMMSLLEKIKDILLPEHMPVMQPAFVSAPQPVTVVKEKRIETVQEKVETKTNTAADDYDYPQTTPLENTMVHEVVVELKLDVSGLFEEEKTEILEAGFDTAVVTLHSVNGREIIHARKTGDKNVPLFLASNIEAGIYIVRATLTQKLSDDYIMNLFGEKTAYITRDNKEVELYIKKYEAID